MRLECTELREFIDLVGEDRALKAVSSFSVKRNPDVESFIRNNAIAYEKSDNARTYLVTNENDDICQACRFSGAGIICRKITREK